MSRTQRLSIRHRPDPPQVVPIHYVELSAPCTPFAFVYRGVRRLCTALRDSDGTIINLRFDCPRCGQPQEFARDLSLTLSRSGRVHAEGLVHCVDACNCGLVVTIVDGLATDARTWW